MCNPFFVLFVLHVNTDVFLLTVVNSSALFLRRLGDLEYTVSSIQM